MALIGLPLVASLAATAWTAAAIGRSASLAARLLVAYVLAWTDVIGLAVVLSLFGLLTPLALLLAQLLLLAVVVVAVRRRRTARRVALRLSREALRRNAHLAPLALGVGLCTGYAAVIAFLAPPNNWDALTYHLARAAAWKQQHSLGWIDNAPTGRMNEFPPNAEIGVAWAFLAGGSERFSAVPQLAATVAIVLAVYVIAVRLRWGRSAAAFAGLLTPTFPQVALQSTTGQNDLIVAAFVASAAAFLLGGGRREPALAGVCVGLALGTKLTAVFALPGLLALGVVALRRRIALPILTAAVTFAALSSWVYVRNLDRAGSLLGEGQGQEEYRPDLTALGVLSTVMRVLYRFVDASGLGYRDSSHAATLAAIAVVAGFAARLRRPHVGWRLGVTLGLVALPAIALPALSTVGAVARAAVEHSGIPQNPVGTTSAPFDVDVNWTAHEDVSYFGPLGILLVVPLVALYVGGWVVKRVPPARGALALSLPLFLLALALSYRYNVWLGRFMVVPVVLVAPLLATVGRRRDLALAVGSTAAAWLVLVHVHNALKPVGDPSSVLTRSRAAAIALSDGGMERTVTALERRVPARACIGALLGVNDAAFLLYGPRLERRVDYLPRDEPWTAAARLGLDAVVVADDVARAPDAAGWHATRLGPRWRLVVRRDGASCPRTPTSRSVSRLRP